MNNNLYMLLTNEYPSESNQNLVHYLYSVRLSDLIVALVVCL